MCLDFMIIPSIKREMKVRYGDYLIFIVINCLGACATLLHVKLTSLITSLAINTEEAMCTNTDLSCFLSHLSSFFWMSFRRAFLCRLSMSTGPVADVATWGGGGGWARFAAVGVWLWPGDDEGGGNSGGWRESWCECDCGCEFIDAVGAAP